MHAPRPARLPATARPAAPCLTWDASERVALGGSRHETSARGARARVGTWKARKPWSRRCSRGPCEVLRSRVTGSGAATAGSRLGRLEFGMLVPFLSLVMNLSLGV